MARSKSKSARHKRFLEAGFFPEEMPPPFVSTDLARHRESIKRELAKIPDKNKEKWFYRHVTRPATYLFPRYRRSDRKHTLLNPISYFYLSLEIAENWGDIKKSLKDTEYSISPVIFDWDGERVFLKLDFGSKTNRTNQIILRNAFIVASDIARYYHSVYTHAIPWAMHTKEVAKKAKDNSLLGNRLDTLVRNGQDGQTIGLPVGPDTSRVLAELLGASIDRRLRHSTKLGSSRVIRFVDDFTAGVATLEEGERVKAAFRKVVHYHELEINEEKTGTVHAHRMDFSSWRHVIKRAVPSPLAAREKYEIFFDTIFAVSDQNPDDNVLRYALKRAATNFLRASEWDVVEDFLLLSYRTNATVLPIIVEILVNRNATGADLNKEKIREFVTTNLDRLNANDKNGEVLWMLFLAKALRIELDLRGDLQSLASVSDPACALVLCDLSARSLLSRPLTTSAWDSFANADGLSSEMWLYAYEAVLKGWSTVSSTFLLADPVFGPLAARKVSFYDINRNVPRLHKRVALDITSARKRAVAFSQNFEEVDIEDLDGAQEIHFGEDLDLGGFDEY